MGRLGLLEEPGRGGRLAQDRGDVVVERGHVAPEPLPVPTRPRSAAIRPSRSRPPPGRNTASSLGNAIFVTARSTRTSHSVTTGLRLGTKSGGPTSTQAPSTGTVCTTPLTRSRSTAETG